MMMMMVVFNLVLSLINSEGGEDEGMTWHLDGCGV